MNRLIFVAILILISLIFDLGLLTYALYVLVAILLVGQFLTRTWMKGLVAKRTVQRNEAEVGDIIKVTLNIENTSSLPIPWVLSEDLLPKKAIAFEPPDLHVIGSRMAVNMLWKDSQKELTYHLQCNRRGYYQIGPMILETGDMFGMNRRYCVTTDPQFLMVFPEIIPLEGYDVASRQPIGEVSMTYRLFEDPSRIAGVREYQQGDSLNRVHWRATARTGQLQCKVYEPSSVAGATLLLDFHESAYDRRHEPVRSELAIVCAASIANALYQINQQFGLVTNGRDAADRIRQDGWGYDIRNRNVARKKGGMRDKSDRLRPLIVPTERGPETYRQTIQALARLEKSTGLTFAQLTLESQADLPRDASVIAFLSEVTDNHVIALSALVNRGYEVTAIVCMYDESEFAKQAGQLLAVGIGIKHLRDKSHISAICRDIVVGR